jgi:ornithine cyclodeaminase/alanine dehydrogenase-like protein (mu-crystallin family)
VTLFKSVGVALADDVATGLVLTAAECRGLGHRVAL